MLRMNRQAMPLSRKITSPTTRIRSLSRPTDSFPDSSTNGMMSSEGSEVSIWISRSLAEGKIVFRSPRIGETASPGNDVTADTDQIANSTGSEIVPLPVDIFMVTGFGFLGRCHNLYASVFGWRRPRCLQTSSGAEKGRESVFSCQPIKSNDGLS